MLDKQRITGVRKIIRNEKRKEENRKQKRKRSAFTR